MKHIILIIAVFLVSCNENTITIPKEEYNNLKGIKIIPPKSLQVGNNGKSRAKFLIELGSDGHEYAHNITDYYDAYVCFHYIDCVKCKKDTIWK